MSIDTEVWGTPRSRTINWHDPGIAAAQLPRMAGLDYLQAILDGELPPPPMAMHFQTLISAVAPGEVEFRCTPDESAYNPLGSVHGGLVCTLLDSVVGCAVHTTLPAGVGYTSLEIKVSYLRAIYGDSGELRAVGRVTKPGKRAAFAEGEVRDAEDRLVATATSTCLVFEL